MADELDGPSRPAASESVGSRDEQFRRALEQIRDALAALRFGQVLVTVQDGVIVQIDRTEKTRLR
jgi:hypothetical protein